MTVASPRSNLRAIDPEDTTAATTKAPSAPEAPAPPGPVAAAPEPVVPPVEVRESAPRPTFPKIFGNYVLEEMLSRGGMAEIYRAQRTGPHSFRKTVALKKILPVLSRNEDFRRLFVEEAKTVALLDHPHIVPVHELGEINDE